MITFEFPRSLGVDVDGRTSLGLDRCETVGEALKALEQRAPQVLDRVMDERGVVRQHVNIFVDGESIKFLEGLDTPLADDSRILVLGAISGG